MNLNAAGAGAVESPLLVEETVFGGPKNEVIDPFALGFLASLVGLVVALRLRDMMGIGDKDRYRKWSSVDTLIDVRSE